MLPISSDYTDRDFDALRERLISVIGSIFPTWTDFAKADFGAILLESFAFVGDVLAFNLDAASREAKWGTATQMRSIIRLAKQIGYRPKGASAASVVATISAPGSLAGPCSVPMGTIVRTKTIPAVEFQTLADVTLTPFALSQDVEVENSASKTALFSASSDPGQTFSLQETPYLDGSAIVSTSQGTWARVDNWLASKSSDLHYLLDVDANDRAVLTTGDGTIGAIPIGDVTVAYKTGGGAAGQIDAGALKEVVGTFADIGGNSVPLSVSNAAKSVGGEEKQTVAAIKVQAPALLRAGNRTVSRADYATRARQAAGVGRALLLTKNEDPVVDLNAGMLWLVPVGLGFLTDTIRSAVDAQYAMAPYPPTFMLAKMDPWYIDISVVARVYLQGSAKAASTKVAVMANLQAYFALTTKDAAGNVVDNPLVDFGWNQQDASGKPVGSVAFSDLFNVVRDTVGIRKVGANPEDFLLTSVRTKTTGSVPVETSVHSDITIAPREFPRFVGLTLLNGDTGLEIV